MKIMPMLARLVHDRRAATAVEYGLIAALVVLAIMVAVQGVASETNRMWTRVSTTMSAATS